MAPKRKPHPRGQKRPPPSPAHGTTVATSSANPTTGTQRSTRRGKDTHATSASAHCFNSDVTDEDINVPRRKKASCLVRVLRNCMQFTEVCDECKRYSNSYKIIAKLRNNPRESLGRQWQCQNKDYVLQSPPRIKKKGNVPPASPTPQPPTAKDPVKDVVAGSGTSTLSQLSATSVPAKSVTQRSSVTSTPSEMSSKLDLLNALNEKQRLHDPSAELEERLGNFLGMMWEESLMEKYKAMPIIDAKEDYELAVTLDGLNLSRHMGAVLAGTKFVDKRTINPKTGEPLFGADGCTGVQSVNNCFISFDGSLESDDEDPAEDESFSLETGNEDGVSRALLHPLLHSSDRAAVLLWHPREVVPLGVACRLPRRKIYAVSRRLLPVAALQRIRRSVATAAQ